MDRQDINTDNEKRGKLLFLAGLISVAIFFTKIFQYETEPSILNVYIKGGLFLIFSVVGLLWSFKFQVKSRSFLYILQSAMFVFSEVLFIDFFFFQKFNRLYEGIILLLILIFVFVATYGSFLMANVFNVNLFKRIPLVHVGRTLSYLLSLLMMYFFTFTTLASELQIYISIPILLFVYFLVIYIHYLNMGIEEGILIRKSLLTLCITFSLFISLLFVGDVHEVISVVPVVGYYFCVTMVTRENVKGNSKLEVFLSFIFVLAVFSAVIFLNLFD